MLNHLAFFHRVALLSLSLTTVISGGVSPAVASSRSIAVDPPLGVQGTVQVAIDTEFMAGSSQESIRAACLVEQEKQPLISLNAGWSRINYLWEQQSWEQLLLAFDQQFPAITQLSAPNQIYPLRNQISWLSNLAQKWAATAKEESTNTIPRHKLLSMVTKTEAIVLALGATDGFDQTEMLLELTRVMQWLEQREQAIALLQRAATANRFIKAPDQRLRTLATMGEYALNLGESQRAQAYLAQAATILTTTAPSVDASLLSFDELWGQIASLYARNGNFSEAIDAAQQISDSPVTQAYTLSNIIVEHVQRGQLDAALQLANTIADSGVKASALLNIAMAWMEEGNIPQATTAYEAALAASQAPDTESGSFGQYPGYALGEYGQWQPDRALQLARLLPNPEDQIQALIPIALHYQQNGQPQQGETVMAMVIRLIDRTAIVPQSSDQVNQFWQKLSLPFYRVVEAQQYDWALKLAEAVQRHANFKQHGNYHAALVSTLVGQAVEQQQLAIAVAAIEQIPLGESTAEVSSWKKTVIAAYLKAEQYGTALELVDRWSEQVSPVAQTEQLKQLEQLEQLEQRLMIATALHQADRDASALLTQAEQITNTLTDVYQKTTALAQLSIVYQKTGQADRAQQMLDQIIRWLEYPPAGAFVTVSTQPWIASQYYEIAFRLAQYVPPMELVVPEPITVMEAILNAGQFELAQRLIPMTHSPEVRTLLFQNLADRYIALGQVEPATDALAQAVNAARAIPDPEARQTMVMGAAAYNYNDPTDRASQLEEIALRYASLGRLEQASQTIALIEAPDIRESIEQRLACF